MSRELTIPEVGENVESIQVVKLLAKPGDTVADGQNLLEIETGKAVVEVPAASAGTLEKFLVGEGDDVTPGQPYAVLGAEGENAEADAKATGHDADAKPEAEKKTGKTESTEQEPDTEETTEAPEAEAEPDPAESNTGDEEHDNETEPSRAASTASRDVPAAPSVRRYARQLGIDIGTVRGNGKHGRVSRENVDEHVRTLNARRAGPAGLALPPLPDFSQWGDVRPEKMSPIRRQTATHMTMCWTAIPHVTIHDWADITELDVLRKQYADRATKAGGKLTMAVMVTRVVASALKAFPKFNASVDMEHHRVIFKDYCNLGIAVATERGLVVPVIREANRKNMVEIAVEISAIAEKARAGKLHPEDMQGGTFTVTNLGRVGGSHFTPIINYPEVAILGMGRTRTERAPDGGGERVMLPLSLSFDHRLIDGAEGAAFLGWVTEAIQEPLVLALEG